MAIGLYVIVFILPNKRGSNQGLEKKKDRKTEKKRKTENKKRKK
jgi:hypothetical protein